jgi:hypothetical protein
MHTVSRHLLRRTARAMEHRLEKAQRVAVDRNADPADVEKATLLMARYGVRSSDVLEVKPYLRGKFGHRVIAV